MTRMYRVRETAAPFNLSGGFRDELVASAMALSLLVVGSFVLTEVFFGKDGSHSPTQTENNPQTLGVTTTLPEQINLLPTPTPILTLGALPIVASAAASPSATTKTATEGAVVAPVVPFGDDGAYDYSAYKIAFANPRIVFDATRNTARKLVVEVTLTNKTVMEGLETRLSASIVKDGVIIVPKAVMRVPKRQTVGPNQQAVFQAELTLVEATDVRELLYEPGGDLPPTSHFLYQ